VALLLLQKGAGKSPFEQIELISFNVNSTAKKLEYGGRSAA